MVSNVIDLFSKKDIEKMNNKIEKKNNSLDEYLQQEYNFFVEQYLVHKDDHDFDEDLFHIVYSMMLEGLLDESPVDRTYTEIIWERLIEIHKRNTKE